MTRPLSAGTLALAFALVASGARAQSAAAFPDVAAPNQQKNQTSAPQAPPPAPAYVAPAPSPGMRFAATDAPTLSPPVASFGWGAPARPPGAMDSGAEPEKSSVSTTAIVGALVLGIPYATGVGVAGSESFTNGSGWLAVPVAGPWGALSARRDPCDGLEDQKQFDSDVGRCVAEPMIRGMLVLDGVLQATGAVLLIVGASSGSSDEPKTPPAPRMVAMPSRVGRNGYGLGVVGQF